MIPSKKLLVELPPPHVFLEKTGSRDANLSVCTSNCARKLKAEAADEDEAARTFLAEDQNV